MGNKYKKIGLICAVMPSNKPAQPYLFLIKNKTKSEKKKPAKWSDISKLDQYIIAGSMAKMIADIIPTNLFLNKSKAILKIITANNKVFFFNFCLFIFFHKN